MTNRSMEIYKFIISYIKENGYAPTYREIGEGVNLSLSSALRYIDSLEDDGWIEIKRGSPRAIKIVGYEFTKVG
ncbi:LexA family protein [Lacrimispora indolis]|uniref:LexA family protein n=1 Tax=Lacrimispora indolis TaxID=69825 RepID=UPI000462B9C5|nr:winged helix-turn-helix transcriptional regulator [[Clostridium] methoxybenzovorans]